LAEGESGVPEQLRGERRRAQRCSHDVQRRSLGVGAADESDTDSKGAPAGGAGPNDTRLSNGSTTALARGHWVFSGERRVEPPPSALAANVTLCVGQDALLPPLTDDGEAYRSALRSILRRAAVASRDE
jgi:hypothetical protein